MDRRRAGALERRQIRQRIGLRALKLPADDQDGQTLSDPKRRQKLLSIRARSVRDHCSLEAAPVGEIEQRKGSEDRLKLAQTTAIRRFFGVKGCGLLKRRQVRKVTTRDHRVGRAHDVRGVFGTIELDSIRRKHALESDEMLGVAIHERTIKIEQQRSFNDARRGAPHIVAPICQGANSASPYPRSSDLVRSPEATARTLSNISSPLSAIETPSRTSPQLMSMSSIILRYVSLLVASLTDRGASETYAAPRPVVKKRALA